MLKKKQIKPTYTNPLLEKLKAKRSRRLTNVRRHPLRQVVKSCK